MPILSVVQLLERGCEVIFEKENPRIIADTFSIALVQSQRSFLLVPHRIRPFNESTMLAPLTTAETIPFKSGHTDFWRIRGTTLIRVHKR